MDVTPLSLGIETMGGVFMPLIPKNTPIPCEASEIFSTTVDYQEMVNVHVLQGERELASENHSLARFEALIESLVLSIKTNDLLIAKMSHIIITAKIVQIIITSPNVNPLIFHFNLNMMNKIQS